MATGSSGTSGGGAGLSISCDRVQHALVDAPAGRTLNFREEGVCDTSVYLYKNGSLSASPAGDTPPTLRAAQLPSGKWLAAGLAGVPMCRVGEGDGSHTVLAREALAVVMMDLPGSAAGVSAAAKATTASGAATGPSCPCSLAVPWGWGLPERAAVRDAASVAGYDVTRVLPAGVAGAVAFCCSNLMAKGVEEERTVVCVNVESSSIDIALVVFDSGIMEAQLAHGVCVDSSVIGASEGGAFSSPPAAGGAGHPGSESPTHGSSPAMLAAIERALRVASNALSNRYRCSAGVPLSVVVCGSLAQDRVILSAVDNQLAPSRFGGSIAVPRSYHNYTARGAALEASVRTAVSGMFSGSLVLLPVPYTLGIRVLRPAAGGAGGAGEEESRLQSKSIKELRSVARLRGVDLRSCLSKQDVVDAILRATRPAVTSATEPKVLAVAGGYGDDMSSTSSGSNRRDVRCEWGPHNADRWEVIPIFADTSLVPARRSVPVTNAVAGQDAFALHLVAARPNVPTDSFKSYCDVSWCDLGTARVELFGADAAAAATAQGLCCEVGCSLGADADANVEWSLTSRTTKIALVRWSQPWNELRLPVERKTRMRSRLQRLRRVPPEGRDEKMVDVTPLVMAAAEAESGHSIRDDAYAAILNLVYGHRTTGLRPASAIVDGALSRLRAMWKIDPDAHAVVSAPQTPQASC